MKKAFAVAVVAAIAGFGWAAYRAGFGAPSRAADSLPGADYPIRPVGFTEVALGPGFWRQRIETNRDVTIPFALEQNEITGRVDNFLKAAGLEEGTYVGERYNDTDVYKVLEGAAYTLALDPNPELDAYLDRVIGIIAAAQEEDGYLFTPRTAPSEELPIGIGEERWSNLAVSHELYNAGHLYEAAVAHYQATGKRNFLEIAINNADLVYATFGPAKLHNAPGHQVIEMGLVKLYRATGDARYLELARFFLDQRGKDLVLREYPEGHRFDIYNDPVQIQAHLPVLEQSEAVGHSVRAMYLYSGMADVAAITGDQAYTRSMATLWQDVVGRKMYLTGGIGGRGRTEGFGDPYDLPNATAYAETCASIGLVFWSWRLFLLSGDAQYLDVLERVLYNGMLAGVSHDGDRFFYPNPLASDGEWGFNQGDATRRPWFGTACCPGNVTRFLPAVSGYVYAQRGADVYVANYIASDTTIQVSGVPVGVMTQTRYPWDGNVRIGVGALAPVEMTLRLRIPGWSRNRPVPTDLYRYEGQIDEEPVLRINGESVPLEIVDGFAVIRRTWDRRADLVELELPMPVRAVRAHDAVDADRDRLAFERGPLVYAFEGVDHGGHIADLRIGARSEFHVERRDDVAGGVVGLRGVGSRGSGGKPFEPVHAIPYFAWSHRGPNEMAVWMAAADRR